MAKPKLIRTKGDTRRRSRPTNLKEQKEAIRSDFQTQLAAEKERWQLIGGLVRMWVRQALGLPGNDQGLKLYLDQMEDGFNRIIPFDPKQKIIGWEQENRPVFIRLNRTATYVPLEDGKAIFATRVKEGESELSTAKKPTNKPKNNG
jgi:hypothetical protein